MRSAHWLYQPQWFVSAAHGDDSRQGDSDTHTTGTTGPLKTIGEVHSRRGPRAWKQDTTITILDDLPPSDPLILNEPQGPFQTKYVGRPTNVTTGSFGTFTGRSPAINQANTCTATTAINSLASYIANAGYRLQLTSGPANGFTCYVAKNLTGSFRVSSVLNATTQAETNPANGDSFAVQTVPAVPVAKIHQTGAVRFDSLRLGGTKLRLQGAEFVDCVQFVNCVIDEILAGAYTSEWLNCCFTSANQTETAYPTFWGGDHFIEGGVVFGQRLYVTRAGQLELASGTLLQGAALSPHHSGKALLDDAGIFDVVEGQGAAINLFNGQAEIFSAWGEGSTYGICIDFGSKVALIGPVGTAPTVTGSAGDVLLDDSIASWSECIAHFPGSGGGIVSPTGQGITITGSFGPTG